MLKNEQLADIAYMINSGKDVAQIELLMSAYIISNKE